MAINTESTGNESKNFISKVMYPGNQTVKINGLKLLPGYKDKELNLILNVETEPIDEPGFEGFLIDKDDEKKGRHKGQVGSVKFSKWAYGNSKYENGQWVDQSTDADPTGYRDGRIWADIKRIITEAGKLDWCQKHPSFDTIEDLVDQFNKDNPVKDLWFEMSIGAREYYSKDNYKRQDLFLIKANKPYKNFKLKGNNLTELVRFDANNKDHLVPAKDVVSSETKTTEEIIAEQPVVTQPKIDTLPF